MSAPRKVCDVLRAARESSPAALSLDRAVFILGCDRKVAVEVLKKLERLGHLERCVNRKNRWRSPRCPAGRDRQVWIDEAYEL